jgi:hypothetical protein
MEKDTRLLIIMSCTLVLQVVQITIAVIRYITR